MKIAVFSDNFYPELSGIADSIIVLAKNLAELGHEIHFFAPKYSSKNFRAANSAVKEINLGSSVKVHRFFSWPYPSPTGQGRLVVPTFWRWLAVKKIKPDIIHTQLFFGTGLEALIAAKLLNIPLIGTNHTPISEFTRYSPVAGSLVEKLSLRYVSWYYNQCDYITAPCQVILDEMRGHGLVKPAKVLSNPIEVANFFPPTEPVKQQLKAKYNLSNKVILYTGRLALEKHVDVLIRAVALAREQASGINLAITGHGNQEYALKILVKQLGLEKQVKFFGTVDFDTHRELYQASDIFAIASTAEMQSLSMMKGMATGLPVIGVRAQALPEYINQNNGFIVEPGDFKAIAEKIVWLFNNPEAAKRLGQGGLAFVQQFDEKNIAREWENIYAKIINL